MKGPHEREASQPAYDLRFRVPWKMELGGGIYFSLPLHVIAICIRTEIITTNLVESICFYVSLTFWEKKDKCGGKYFLLLIWASLFEKSKKDKCGGKYMVLCEPHILSEKKRTNMGESICFYMSLTFWEKEKRTNVVESIHFYVSLTFWERKKGQISWKVYTSTSIDNLRSQPAFGRLRIIPLNTLVPKSLQEEDCLY